MERASAVHKYLPGICSMLYRNLVRCSQNFRIRGKYILRNQWLVICFEFEWLVPQCNLKIYHLPKIARPSFLIWEYCYSVSLIAHDAYATGLHSVDTLC